MEEDIPDVASDAVGHECHQDKRENGDYDGTAHQWSHHSGSGREGGKRVGEGRKGGEEGGREGGSEDSKEGGRDAWDRPGVCVTHCGG